MPVVTCELLWLQPGPSQEKHTAFCHRVPCDKKAELNDVFRDRSPEKLSLTMRFPACRPVLTKTRVPLDEAGLGVCGGG